MSKLIVVIFSVLAITASAGTTLTASTPSVSTSSFNSTPVKVYDQSVTADAAWASKFTENSIAFGAASQNTTLYAYGWTFDSTSSPTKISNIERRSINATVAGNASDTTDSSLITDTAIGVSTPSNSLSAWAATYPNVLFIATLGVDSSSNTQVYVQVVVGTSPTQVQLTTNPTVAATATANGITASYSVLNTFQQDGIFYVLYALTSACTDCTGAGATCVCSGLTPALSKTATVTTVYLQGVNSTASTPAALWTKAVAVASGLSETSGSLTNGAISASNYTNSTSIYALWKQASTSKTYAAAVSVSAGTAGSATTITTDVAASSTVTSGFTYTVIGGVGSNPTYGWGIGVDYITYVAAANTHVYGASLAYNGSTTLTSVANFSSASGPATSLMGTVQSTGYLVEIVYPSSSGANNNFAYQSYYYNGTANGTIMTIGQINGPTSTFNDVNGTLWFGYTTYDTTTSPYVSMQGYVGKLVGQIWGSSSSASSILSTFFAFVTLMIAAIFAF